MKKEYDHIDTALLEAVKSGEVETVKSLLEEGADANVRDAEGPAILHAVLSKDPTPEAATSIVRLLTRAGADVNVRGFEGLVALQEAVRSGLTDAVKALLEAGARVNLRGVLGETALDIAEEKGLREITGLLEKARPKGKKMISREPFMKKTIQKGRDRALVFSLIMAVQGNNLEEVERLIAGGVDVNARDKVTGLTALFLAVREGYVAIAEALLKAGANKGGSTVNSL